MCKWDRIRNRAENSTCKQKPQSFTSTILGCKVHCRNRQFKMSSETVHKRWKLCPDWVSLYLLMSEGCGPVQQTPVVLGNIQTTVIKGESASPSAKHNINTHTHTHISCVAVLGPCLGVPHCSTYQLSTVFSLSLLTKGQQGSCHWFCTGQGYLGRGWGEWRLSLLSIMRF